MLARKPVSINSEWRKYCSTGVHRSRDLEFTEVVLSVTGRVQAEVTGSIISHMTTSGRV